MDNNRIESLAHHEFSNVRILVDYSEYDIKTDKRLLIPFSYYQHYGLINRIGEIVVQPKFDRILDSCFDKDDLIRVGIFYTYGFNRKDEPATYMLTKWGLIDSCGDFILDPEFRGIGVSDNKKTLTLNHMDGQYEVITVDGETIVPKGKYQWIDSFDSGYARVNFYDGEDKYWGLIDDKGNEILPLKYYRIWNFFHKNRKWITIEAIDEHGNKRVGRFDFLTRELSF